MHPRLRIGRGAVRGVEPLPHCRCHFAPGQTGRNPIGSQQSGNCFSEVGVITRQVLAPRLVEPAIRLEARLTGLPPMPSCRGPNRWSQQTAELQRQGTRQNPHIVDWEKLAGVGKVAGMVEAGQRVFRELVYKLADLVHVRPHVAIVWAAKEKPPDRRVLEQAK
jgi:hypothetical protein